MPQSKTIVSLSTKNWRRKSSRSSTMPVTLRHVAPARNDWDRGTEITLREVVFEAPALRLADGALRLEVQFASASPIEIPANAVKAANAAGYRHRGAGFILEIPAAIFAAQLPPLPETAEIIAIPNRTAA